MALMPFGPLSFFIRTDSVRCQAKSPDHRLPETTTFAHVTCTVPSGMVAPLRGAAWASGSAVTLALRECAPVRSATGRAVSLRSASLRSVPLRSAPRSRVEEIPYDTHETVQEASHQSA
jgi:hypothetical protein